MDTGANDRSEIARHAARASHSVSTLVGRISRRRNELTARDRAILLELVGNPTAADAYAAGVRDGAAVAADRITTAVREVTGR
jgi:hypothetical protein